MPIDPAIPDDTPNTKDPVVNISDPEVKVDSKTDGEQHDPGRDADSSGTEQTIQGTPTKPDAPEHPGKTEKDHAADDVPEADRNKETPPSYKPEQTEVKPQLTEPAGGSTNDAGQVYVPGFGYITPSGPNDGGTLNDMYENGNKIGIMAADLALPRETRLRNGRVSFYLHDWRNAYEKDHIPAAGIGDSDIRRRSRLCHRRWQL